MRTHSRIIIGALVVLVAVVAAVVWSTRSTAPVPQYQNRVPVPGSTPHPVSLWIEPSPASVGPTELTVQIADPAGMPIPADDVLFYIFPANSFPEGELTGTYTPDAPIDDFLGTGHGYRTEFDFHHAGDWHVEVHFTLAGQSATTIFDIEVED